MSVRVRLALLILSAVLSGPSAIQAHPLKHWHWRNPGPQGNPLYALEFDSSLFIAAGFGGTILTSTNGVDWQQASVASVENLSAVAAGGGLYVIGGNNGTILRTTDGTNWAIGNAGVPGQFVGMVYAEDQFVALTSNGWLARSSDGITWTSELLSTIAGFTDIAYGNGVLALTAEWPDRSGRVWTRTNATNWTVTYFTYRLYGITYGAGKFVVGGARTTYVSADGIAWQGVQGIDFYDIVHDVVHGAAGYVATGYRDTFGGPATSYTSHDGLIWQRHFSGESYKYRRIAFGNGDYVAAGESGAIATSRDGSNWTVRLQGPKNSFRSITRGARTYVAVGEEIATSSDGIAWQPQSSPIPSDTISAVTYGHSKFVAVTRQELSGPGKILCSTNATDWKVIDPGTNVAMWGAAFEAGRFFVTGGEGRILSSVDGEQWQIYATDTVYPLLDIAQGGGTFVAAGGGFLSGPSIVAYSTNGSNWATLQPRNHGPLFSLAYGKGKFVAVGALNTLLYSADGIVWSDAVYSSPFLHAFQDVHFGDDQFVAIGFEPAGERRNFIITSSDGVNWTLRLDSAIFPYLRSLHFADGYFLAAGDQGAILQSSYAGFPRLFITRGSDSILQLCVAAQKSSSYRLQSASALDQLNWEDEGSILDAEERSCFSIWKTNSARFYRIATP